MKIGGGLASLSAAGEQRLSLKTRIPYLIAAACKGPFIHYVITFLGFLDPPPPLGNHVFSTDNNQILAFSDPPPPYK